MASTTPATDRSAATDEPGRLSRLATPLATGAGVGLTTLALHLRDPHVDGSWGFCPTALMGFACPFCGGLRAVNDLTRLDLGAALSSNLLLVVAVPVVLVLWLRRLSACWRGGGSMAPLRVTPVTWWSLTLVVGAFTVVRNTSGGAWLAP